jgi:hypothetical protein
VIRPLSLTAPCMLPTTVLGTRLPAAVSCARDRVGVAFWFGGGEDPAPRRRTARDRAQTWVSAGRETAGGAGAWIPGTRQRCASRAGGGGGVVGVRHWCRQLRSVERRWSICGATVGKIRGQQRGEDAHLGVVMEEGFRGRRRCRQWRRMVRRRGIRRRGAEVRSSIHGVVWS